MSAAGRRALALGTFALCVASAGCADSTTVEQIPLGGESSLMLALPGYVGRTAGDGRVAYRLSSGAIVTVQHVPLSDETRREERTVASGAAALVTRMALGEHQGQLSERACRIGQITGHCVEGSVEIERDRFRRRGIVFAAPSRLVWLDVARADHHERVATESDAIIGAATVLTSPQGEEAGHAR